MKTLNDEVVEYIHACYPEGVGEVQSREIRRAFIGGALATLTKMIETVNQPLTEDQMVGVFEMMRLEILREGAKYSS